MFEFMHCNEVKSGACRAGSSASCARSRDTAERGNQPESVHVHVRGTMLRCRGEGGKGAHMPSSMTLQRCTSCTIACAT